MQNILEGYARSENFRKSITNYLSKLQRELLYEQTADGTSYLSIQQQRAANRA
jgi:hypothetical protein